MKKDRILDLFIILLAVFFFLPTLGWACTVTDTPTTTCTCAVPICTISSVMSCAKKGDTIQISGTCQDNVIIPVGGLTLEGTGTSPTVQALDSSAPVFTVSNKDVAITGLTITGGTTGIYVGLSGLASISGNTISGASDAGVLVSNSGYASIINNTISGNSDAGILVMENASAHIGFSTYSDTIASQNVITGNGTGIVVRNTSSAAIVGNKINGNTQNGILVARLSQADIADNTIDGNGLNGIAVTGNSVVNLAESILGGIYATVNSTDGNSENLEFGLVCLAGGCVSGYLGSLDGAEGDTTIDPTCINVLVVSPYTILGTWNTTCSGGSGGCPTQQMTFSKNGKGTYKSTKPGSFTWNLAGLELTVIISHQTMYGPITWGATSKTFTWTYETVGQSGTTTMTFAFVHK